MNCFQYCKAALITTLVTWKAWPPSISKAALTTSKRFKQTLWYRSSTCLLDIQVLMEEHRILANDLPSRPVSIVSGNRFVRVLTPSIVINHWSLLLFIICVEYSTRYSHSSVLGDSGIEATSSQWPVFWDSFKTYLYTIISNALRIVFAATQRIWSIRESWAYVLTGYFWERAWTSYKLDQLVEGTQAVLYLWRPC